MSHVIWCYNTHQKVSNFYKRINWAIKVTYCFLISSVITLPSKEKSLTWYGINSQNFHRNYRMNIKICSWKGEEQREKRISTIMFGVIYIPKLCSQVVVKCDWKITCEAAPGHWRNITIGFIRLQNGCKQV